MHTFLNDPVDVIVTFTKNKVRPIRLRWEDRLYDLKRVNLVHTSHEGSRPLYYFSVSDDTNAFTLKLDPERLEWRLTELYTDG